jgi:hypothetical protein
MLLVIWVISLTRLVEKLEKLMEHSLRELRGELREISILLMMLGEKF